MNAITVNRLLPKGFYASFVEAEDESVDSEFQIITDDHADTLVALQLGSMDVAVNRFDPVKQTVRHWPVRQLDQTEAIRKDFAEALADIITREQT